MCFDFYNTIDESIPSIFFIIMGLTFFKYLFCSQNIDPNFKILEAIKEVKEISLRKEILSKDLEELDKKVKY